MYRVAIVGPDGIIIRSIYIDGPLDSKQENSLLGGFPGDCWIDISRYKYEVPMDEACAWDDPDYEECWDTAVIEDGRWLRDGEGRLPTGYVMRDGRLVLDYWANNKKE